MARILAITVAYESDKPGEPVMVTLEDIARHCRPERVRELVEDLAVLCEDVLAGRRPEDRGPLLTVVPDA